MLTEDELELGVCFGCPQFEKGWRRFCASTLVSSLSSAKWLASFALKNPHSFRDRFTKRIRDAVDNGCCAWVWIAGYGDPDGLRFSDCCEVCDYDSKEMRREFLELFGGPEDKKVRQVSSWVRSRWKAVGHNWLEESDD